jgi:hypothetical protein
MGPSCDPSVLKISQDKPGQGANFEQIRQLIGNPS